ncbi:GAF domain-containing protein [Aggregatilinea lenta]|uniref:GAF domain-containing protein n=1 Tax=Aggregatilinea lenta TaxID=913108 RepID=UPI000E5AA504|nr:GAF domain-containing protein [Aggregatilinea lenta]
MIEVFLIVIGVIFFAWLYALIRQTQHAMVSGSEMAARPVVPVSLGPDDEAVLLAEGRGRIIWANDIARQWFEMDGGTPSLGLMTQMINPPDVLFDLLAEGGHASFRLGKRRIEAVSHAVPEAGGRRMLVVMREGGRGGISTTDFDPLRAMAIATDISQVVGAGLTLSATIEGILRTIRPAVAFERAEITLWQPESQTLRIAGEVGESPPERSGPPIYQLGEGYSGWIAVYRQPLLIGDAFSRADVTQTSRVPFKSYLGVPLVVSGRFVGTLGLMDERLNAFAQRDQALLMALSEQIAAAVEVARVYRDQTARVAELSGVQQITNTLSDLDNPTQVFGHLTERLSQVIDVRICGVLAYDDETQTFRAQLPFHGVDDEVMAPYRLALEPGTELYGIWQRPWWFTNDPDDPQLDGLALDDLRGAVELKSVVLIPMVLGARRVGLLLAANRQDGRPFAQDDMRSMTTFAAQAAVVIENARLYVEGQRRTQELSALREIGQAVGVLRAPTDLYAQITTRLAELLDARLCGVLLYDPEDRLLISQTPFYGLDDDDGVAFYRVPLPPGSPSEEIWLRDEPWISADVRHDERLGDSDLGRLASLVGIRQTIIAPLVAGGRRLGVIQVGNKVGGGGFTEDDARMLTVFTEQAALLIDSARVYRQMQRRTHEAEGLRAITEIASEPAPGDDTFEQVLVAIANLLESSVVSLALLDEGTGQLVIAPTTVWGLVLDEPYAIDTYSPGFENSVLVSRQPFISNNLRDDRQILPPYRALIGQFNLVNAILVPVSIHGHSIGEMSVANRIGGEPYTQDDADLLAAIATQIAAMIDRMRLYQSTDAGLRQRLRELDSLSRVTFELSQTIELDRVLEVIRQEMLRSTDATAVSIALLAPHDDWPSPDEPLIERRLGEAKLLADLAPIEKLAIVRRDAVLVTDYAQETQISAAPDSAQSALAAPVVFEDQAMAVIHLFADAPGVIDTRVIEFGLAVSNQAAIAIGNARRYQEQIAANQQLRVRAERMGRISELGERFRQGATLPDLLAAVANSVRETVGFDAVLISIVDERGQVLHRTAQAGMSQSDFDAVRQVNPPLAQAHDLMQSRFRISGSFFIPAEGSADLPQNLPTYSLPTEPQRAGQRAWHPDDLLLVPIYGAERRLIGLMSVDQPRSGRRPTVDTIEALELFASQAAFSIENFRLIERIQQEAEATRRERDRLAQLHLVASEIQNAPDVPSRLQVVAEGIKQAGWKRVVITLRDERLEPTSVISAGYSADESELLATRVLNGERWRQWIKDLDFHEMKIGAGFYLRYSHPWVRRNVYGGEPAVPSTAPLDIWHPQDVFYLPLVGQDQKRIIGIIEMSEPVDGSVPTVSSLQPFELFASQAAAAIETTRLYLETVRAAEQEQRLNEMMEAVSSSLNADSVIEAIGHGLQQMVPFTRMSVALYDESTGLFNISRASPTPGGAMMVTRGEPLPVDETAIGAAYRELQPRLYRLQYESASRAIYRDLDAWYADGERTTLVVPTIVAGQAVGALHLGSEIENAFGFRENLELIQRLANLSGVALENARLFNAARQRATELDAQAQRLAVINRVSTRLAETLDPQEIYRIVVSELAEALHVQHAGLVLIEGETAGRLAMDYPFVVPLPDLTIGLEGNLSIERVRETRHPLVSADVLHDPLFEQAWDALRERSTLSLMIVPLVVGETLIGTIGLDSTVLRSFTDAEIELAETIASQASLAIEKARLYNETLSLTIFNQSVVESIRQGIVVMDLDLRLRRINQYMIERYGWSHGGVGKKLFDFRPDYADFLRPAIAIVLGTSEPQVEYEVERTDPSGERSIRNYYVYPMLEGRTVTGIVLLVEDVTERAKLEADLNQRAIQMATLTEVSSQITATLEPDQVITLVLDALGSVIPFDGVTLWLRATDRPELHVVAARGYAGVESPNADDLVGLSAEIASSPLLAQIAEGARVVNVADMTAAGMQLPYMASSPYKSWLGSPLISKGNVVGVLTLEKQEPEFYTALDEQLALTFANQAAVALDNAQLFQETRARALALNEQAQRLALLNRVSLALAQTLDIENIFEIALREAAIALDVSEGSAMQVDPHTMIGRVIVHFPRGDEPPSEVYDLQSNPAMEDMQRTLIPLAVEDLENDPLRDTLLAMSRRTGIKSLLMVPLVVGGNVIGTLRLEATDRRRWFNDAQIELAQTIATQAAIAVQNAALFEQAAARNRELETLFESAQATAVTLDLNEVIRRVTVQVLSALRADACTVFLWDDVNNRLEVRDDISARMDGVMPDQPGDQYNVADYPLRERALRERELVVVRATDDDVPDNELSILQRHGAATRVLVPLVVNEIAIGLVELETLDPNRFFATDDMRLARTLASQAAISIENARLQTETRRTVEELYIINDMSAGLSSATNLSELLQVVADQLPNLTEAEAIYVALFDAERKEWTFPLTVADDEPFDMAPQPLGSDEFSLVLKRQAPLLLAGEHQDDVRRSLGIHTLLPPEMRCFLGVPLFAADELIGVLAIRDDSDDLAFTHNDQRILTTVGSQLGVAIQSARLFQQTVELASVLEQRVRERTSELEQERQQLSTLYQITTELSTSLDVERLLDRALAMVAESVNATQAAILAVDANNNRLTVRARYGDDVALGDGGDSLEIGEGLAGWAIQNHQSLVVHNVQQDPRWLRLGVGDDVPQAAIATLIEANDDVLGVMMLYRERPGAFSEDHLRLASAAANQVANAMNNAELYSLIRDQAERLATLLRQEQVEATKSGAILDSVADGVIVADPEGHVIVFNSTAERILGRNAGQAMRSDLVTFAETLGVNTQLWVEAIAGWMNAPASYRPGDFLDERIELDDGRVLSVRFSPVTMEDQFLGTVGVFRDITRDVEVDRLKSEFVATVSHELRTPMTSIKGYADLLLLGAAGAISDQQQHFLETIKHNADRLSILVNDLLDISRIDQGRVELRFGAVDLNELLCSVSDHLRGRIEDEKRPMNVSVRLPEGESLPIWGDYDKMAQVFTNLADNAFNYTPDGGQITLATTYDLQAGNVTVAITDTGIGIAPDLGERIFERFNRGDEGQDRVMNTPGTGLGLAIVREFVTMHHGRIWYESQPEKGTTFFVELPIKQSETASTTA